MGMAVSTGWVSKPTYVQDTRTSHWPVTLGRWLPRRLPDFTSCVCTCHRPPSSDGVLLVPKRAQRSPPPTERATRGQGLRPAHPGPVPTRTRATPYPQQVFKYAPTDCNPSEALPTVSLPRPHAHTLTLFRHIRLLPKYQDDERRTPHVSPAQSTCSARHGGFNTRLGAVQDRRRHTRLLTGLRGFAKTADTRRLLPS